METDVSKLHTPDFSVAWKKKMAIFFSVFHALELGMALRRGC